MNSDTLFPHLAVSRYGRFVLPDAIRPGAGVPIRPRQGYRTGIYRDRAAGLKLPMLSAAVSAEHLFDAFLALIEPLGEEVTAVLESSHGRDADDYREFRRDRIDAPVLASHFCDFEKLLTHDGCTGVAVLAARRPVEQYLLQPGHPVAAQGARPVVLLDPQVTVLRLPMALPVVGAGVLPTGKE